MNNFRKIKANLATYGLLFIMGNAKQFKMFSEVGN